MNTVAMLLLLALASFVLLVALPTLARRTAVYMIHDVREQAYDFGDAVPGAKECALYGDLLFMCACALRTVGEGRVRDVFTLAMTLSGTELFGGERGSAPKLEPALQTEQARRELLRMGCQLRRITNAAWWATVWSSPFALVLVAPIAIAFAVALRPKRRALDGALAQGERPERNVVAQAKKAANALRQRPSLSATLAETLRHARPRAAA